MRQVTVTALAVLLLSLSGCADSHEKVTAELLSTIREFNDVLESVTDVPTAEAARPRLERLSQRMEEIHRRQEALGSPTEAQRESLEAKYGEALLSEMGRSVASMFRIGFDPALAPILGDVLESAASDG